MSTPNPGQEHHDVPIDAEVSTSSAGSSAVPGIDAPDERTPTPAEVKKARKSRRRLIVVGVLILALIGWVIFDQVRAPDPAPPGPPPASSQPATTTPQGPAAAGTDAAVQTVLTYVTLSYGGKWDQACNLRLDQATCVKVSSGTPAYPLTRPAEVLKAEAFPPEGVAGQAYTGVLVSVVQKGASEPALLAYLVNTSNKIAGFEPVTSEKARLTLRQILAGYIK